MLLLQARLVFLTLREEAPLTEDENCVDGWPGLQFKVDGDPGPELVALAQLELAQLELQWASRRLINADQPPLPPNAQLCFKCEPPSWAVTGGFAR
jgi:hypothetical protein